MTALTRFWRVFRVGLVYATFGGAIAVTTRILVPIRCFLAGTRDGADLFAQRSLHRAARLVRWLAVGLKVVDLQLEGLEKLPKSGPILLVANHPSKLDATFLVSLMPQLDTIVQDSWANAPIISGAVETGGYLRNSDPRRVIDEAVRRLAEGRRVLIFPEGSRSPAGELNDFHRGAARIALASGCDLQTIIIRCDPPFGLKGRPWYDIPSVTPRMSIRAGEALSPKDWTDGNETPGVAARKVTRALRDYFDRELNDAHA